MDARGRCHAEWMLSAWHDFFAAEVTAFAALTGLVFVAISINLQHVLTGPGLSGRAGEAVIVLAVPVLAGLVGLVPSQVTGSLGAELLAIGLVAWVAVSAILLRSRASLRSRARGEIVTRLLLVQGSTLGTVVAGTALLAGSVAGLDCLVVAVLLSLVTGLLDAWVLLVEILR